MKANNDEIFVRVTCSSTDKGLVPSTNSDSLKPDTRAFDYTWKCFPKAFIDYSICMWRRSENPLSTICTTTTIRVVFLEAVIMELSFRCLIAFNAFSPADQDTVFANSVDPHEMAHDEPFHQDIHDLKF